MKKRQIVLYIVVMIMLITTSVYATISADLNLKAVVDSNMLYQGSEFSVTLNLKDLKTDGPIKAIEGYIDIDEEVIDPLTVESIVTDEDGKVKIDEKNVLTVFDAKNISSNSDTGIIFNTDPVSDNGDYKIVINFANPIEEDTDLVTLKFKVKDDATVGDHSSAVVYKIFKLFSEDAQEKQELNKKGLKVTVNAKKDDVNNVPENKPENNPENKPENVPQNVPENKPENKTENVPENKPQSNQDQNKNENQKPTDQGSNDKNSNGNKDNTVAPTNLPKTGYKMILIPIAVIAGLGFVFYKKYSKYNNYHE